MKVRCDDCGKMEDDALHCCPVRVARDHEADAQRMDAVLREATWCEFMQATLDGLAARTPHGAMGWAPEEIAQRAATYADAAMVEWEQRFRKGGA